MTSIIIPVYNGADVLPTTIPAVLAMQECRDILWVDDGSTDQTAQLLADAASDDRVRVIGWSANRGRSAARNAGVDASHGETLVFLDADVEPEPETASRLTSAAMQGAAIASVARFHPVPTHPDEPYQEYAVRHSRGPATPYPTDAPLDWRFFLTGAAGVRRQAFEGAGGFPESIAYGEDLAFGCRLANLNSNGLRLAPTSVRLHDLGDLDRAVLHAAQFGRSAIAVDEQCDSGVHHLRRMERLAPLARIATPTLQRVIRMSPPGPFRRRAVRYLLGLTALESYRRARDHAATAPGVRRRGL